MLKSLLLICLLSIAACEEGRKQRYEDPFAVLDKHISHSLAYHYLWPWSQLMRAAAALDAEDGLEEPVIKSDPTRFEVRMNVKRFKPEELKIKVKNHYVVVEGKHKETQEEQHFLANHFAQRFMLPAGSKPEEVAAVFEEGVLSISAPKHPLPPPPPEREVPIEVRFPEITLETELIEPTSKPNPPIQTSSATPLEQLDLTEATTHAGKIRKKELKSTTKNAKDNEVTKAVDDNGLDLDYTLIETK